MKNVVGSLMFAFSAVAFYACASDLPPSDVMPSDGAVRVGDFGKPCATSADCSGGACIDVSVAGGTIEKRCSAPCGRDLDCVPGWLCSEPGSGGRATCTCSGTRETCDGLDNDCNGIADDEKPATESCAAAGRGLCVNGACTCEHRCDGECVDTKSNALHCGACNAACPPGAACVDGACRCEARTAASDGGDGGDASDGGDAGLTTPPSMLLCDNACVDVSSDPLRCGSCSAVCGPNEACVDSKCVCKGQLCGGACVDTATDLANCGQCGAVCGYACEAGRCTVETIASRQTGIVDFALQGTKIYWSLGERLLACDKHGCASPSVLNTFRAISELAVTNDKIYALLEEYSANTEPTFESRFTGIGVCPVAGCPGTPNAYTVAPRMTATGFTNDRIVSSFVATADSVLFSACGGGNACVGSRFIRVCGRANDCASGPRTLVEDADPKVAELALIGADDANVYWRTESFDGGLQRWAIRSCALPACAGGPRLVTQGDGDLRDVALEGATLFVTVDDPDSAPRSGVGYCPVTGCTTPTMIVDGTTLGPNGTTPGKTAVSVAASSARVYWGRAALSDSGGLYSCARTPGGGCSGPITILEPERGIVAKIAVDEASVYWLDGAQSLKRFSHRLE